MPARLLPQISVMSEELKAEDRVECLLDASAGGCPGMYWWVLD